MAATVGWVLLACLTVVSSQILRQYTNTTLPNQGICRSKVFGTLRMFQKYYKDCIVVIGTLQLTLMEKTDSDDFVNVSFPNLREVTDFLVVYRVKGLHSLGQLFPNLARIRGEKLLNNYGLIVHDMVTLREIGLYSLLKIDRGGVMIWGVPRACFIDTVDWRTVVPQSRLVISPQDPVARCNFRCTCSLNSTVNHCWNNRKCQIYLEGPEADRCHEQCLGCRKTRSDECTLCRNYTHNGKCVAQCPSNTILLPNSQYCITKEECENLHGWVWNNTCVFHCPIDYEEESSDQGTTCKYCSTCYKTCPSLDMWAVGKVQEAEGCVYINGSLEIHIRPVSEIMEELVTFLNRIQEVTDYVEIYSSSTITSLSFLSSLKRIRGRNLKYGKYSLIIHNMASLQTLFTPNVTQSLKIDRGTLKMYHNPVLCKIQIDVIRPLFPVQPNNETDIPTGMNGYSGDCEDGVDFQVRIINETSVVIMFSTLTDPDAHYSVLYVHLPPGVHQNLVPESCSESEWYAVNADTSFGHQFGIVELTSLRPASTYAVCIETYDPVHKILARSTIYNFTTPTGIPEPPFIKELYANKSSTIVVSWLGHKDYLPFIKYYALEVSLIEIYQKDIAARDQCKNFEYTKFDPTLHGVVMTPPPEYIIECAANCRFISNVSTPVAPAIEEHFDVCRTIICDNLEEIVPNNSSFGKYVKTLALKLNASKTCYLIEGLAPFRDYKVNLRACTESECSRSARGVVRTLPFEDINTDVPSDFHVNEDDNGYISIRWKLPNVTNGPILSYQVEILPEISQDWLNILPLTWCVLANETSLKVKTIKVSKYSVRVCARSMALDAACTVWKSVEAAKIIPMPTWWWTGVIFAGFLYIASILAGSMIRRRSENIDLQPILESSSSVDQSEPPCKMFSDFAPMYNIPLRDTRLE